jgi:DNA primase
MIGTKRSLSPGDTETVGSGSQQPSRLVKTAIKLLLHEPSLAMMVDDPPLLASLECPRVALLVSLLELVQKRSEISAGAMLERWRGTAEEDYFSQLIGEEFLVPKKGIKEEFSGAIARLRELSLKRKREALLKLKTRPDHLTPAEKEELRRTRVLAKGSKEPL